MAMYSCHYHTATQKHRHTDTQTHRHTDTQTHKHTYVPSSRPVHSEEPQPRAVETVQVMEGVREQLAGGLGRCVRGDRAGDGIGLGEQLVGAAAVDA